MVAADRGPVRTVTITVNQATASVPASAVLLSALRDQLGLTGAKLGCGEGACGTCTVLVDGEPVRSCQRTAGSVAGRVITTIEGLAPASTEPDTPVPLHPVQRAFAADCAAQCGYCTPGMVLATAALLAREPRGAMFEAIRFSGGAVTNSAFSRYRVPRMADFPPIEVILLDRPDLPSAGADETPMIAVAPAIANAIFEATGRRLRSLPLTDDGRLPDAS